MHSEGLHALARALAPRYSIKGPVGEGGMATVYRAWDEELAQDVAIKVLRPELAASLGVERFAREVRLTASLRHPNILPLLGSGQAAGLPFYVTPYVDGESLKDRLQRQRHLPIPEAIDIALTIASALAAAHGQGIVHRDIKPSNVFLKDGHVFVSDFGIARVIGAADEERITDSGIAIGTPAYMSPEQAAGQHDVDGRTDLYSLGCVLFEMLAGEPPFTGRTRPAVLAKQLSLPPPPVTTVRPSVPAAVDQVIRRSLAKVPEDRFPTAEAWAAALEAAARDGRLPPARWTVRRIVSVVRVTFLAASVIGLGWWLALTQVGGGAEELSTRYAVFPLELGPGVDLTFDGSQFLQDAVTRWIDLSIADPILLREEMGRTEPGQLTQAAAAQIARELGAGLFLRGQVTSVGDSIRVRAVLSDAQGMSLGEQVARMSREPRTAEGAFADLLDRLLLRNELPEGEITYTGTRNLGARRAFLAGQRALRDWVLSRADSAFTRAAELDASYAEAHLHVALARLWLGQPSATWAVGTRHALLGLDRLDPRDRAIADALSAHERNELGVACRIWNDLTERAPEDFLTWYGSAHCQADDEAVVPDRQSPSGWAFRSSYHSALAAYQAAFRLSPSLLSSLRRDSFASLRSLLKTGGNEGRFGRAIAPDTSTFRADLAWRGDSLVFVPYRLDEGALITVAPADVNEAVRRQREIFRDVSTTWVSTAPGSPDAKHSLAIALAMLGDPTSLDTLNEARALADDSDALLPVLISEVWMRLAEALPRDPTGLARARALVDTVLGGVPGSGPGDPLMLSGVAALTGRAGLAARHALAPRAAERVFAAPLRGIAPALLIYSALGGPTDSLRTLEKRMLVSIENQLPPASRFRALYEWVGYPATLAFPAYRFESLPSLSGNGDPLLDAQAAWAAGDAEGAWRDIERLRQSRRDLSPWYLTIDGIYPEAALILELGDPREAALTLDPTLGSLLQMSPDVLSKPERAASLVRAAAMRAMIAARLGDLRTAREWASAVIILWSDADAFLEPILDELRSLAM